VSITRLVLILVGLLLLMDHQFGSDRLLASTVSQVSNVGYKLTGTFSQVAGWISP
jgi:hypothetical protein